MFRKLFTQALFAPLGAVFFISIGYLGISLLADQWTAMVYSDVNCLIVDMLAVAMLFIAAISSVRDSRRSGLAWGVLAMAMLFYTLGDFAWLYLDVYVKTSPLNSVLGGLYLCYYPLFLIWTLLLPKSVETRLKRIKRALDIAIIVAASFLVYWNFTIAPAIAEPKSFVEYGRYVVMPVLGLLMLSGALTLTNRLVSEKSGMAIVFVFSGAIILVITDGIYSYQALHGMYASGGTLDFGWIAAFLLTALGGAAQAQGSKPDAIFRMPRPTFNRLLERLNGFFLYLPYVLLMAAYALLIESSIQNARTGFLPMAIGVGIIIILVIARRVVTHIDNTRLNDQLEHALEEVRRQALALTQTNVDLQIEITERKRAEEQLSHDALHDWLTGLPNRMLFTDRLGQAIEYTQRRPDYPFSVLFLDLDQFKIINDSLGHKIGDELLIEVSKRLLKCLRSSDTVARLGGDEFVILLENTDGENSATYVTERILREFEMPFRLEEQDIFMTVSIGIVLNVLGYNNPDEVLKDADLAMYRAKELGKAQSVVFSQNLRVRAVNRLEMENELRQALANKEFELYYQPIIAIGTNHIMGLEALIRWRHPKRGLLPPVEFIPLAEESGLIIPIGKWVLNEACRQLKNWQDVFSNWRHIILHVNVSGKQLSQPDFVDVVLDAVQTNGLNPRDLKLEITESVLIENYDAANKAFEELKNLGIQLGIDDFGTGYSSLGYLQHFPVQTIKIDKSFISEVGKGGKETDIIRAMIVMAKDLGMDTVAEGVETKEQYDELERLMCPYGQGFLLSKPLDAVSVEKFFTTWNSDGSFIPRIERTERLLMLNHVKS
jgi:diguanylate cyclase (GGDEF)-like protein